MDSRLQASERAELWRRFRAGETLRNISRALARDEAGVSKHVWKTGGFVPPVPKRRVDFLTAAEREEISRGLSRCESLRAISRRLRRSPSPISRELTRNGGRTRYRAARADLNADVRARRPKRCKLACNGHLRRKVASLIRQDWSPEQISNWLKVHYSSKPAMRISTETIYRSLFIQARGVLKKERTAHLRSRRKRRHAKADTVGNRGRRG